MDLIQKLVIHLDKRLAEIKIDLSTVTGGTSKSKYRHLIRDLEWIKDIIYQRE